MQTPHPTLTFPPGRTYRAFDARVQVPKADGTLLLPSWLSYTCATAETSAQTGAATVRTGFAANAPRAFSRDGSTWGLLVEPAATNLWGDQDVSGAGYSSTGTPIVSAATAPNGAAEAWRIQDDDGAAVEYRQRDNFGTITIGTTYALATWKKNIDGADANAICQVVESGVQSFYQLSDDGVADAAWELISGTFTAGASSAAGAADGRLIAGSVAADTNRADFWGMQLEVGAYQTSFIGADNVTFTRAVGTLTADTDALAPRGHYAIPITFRPHYSSTELGVDAHTLLYWDANNYVQLVNGKADMVIDAVVSRVTGLTWSRHQELLIYAEHSPQRKRIITSGFTAGNTTLTEAATAASALPATCEVLGGGAGAEHGSDIRRIAALFT